MKIAIFKYAIFFGGGEKYTQLLGDGLENSVNSSHYRPPTGEAGSNNIVRGKAENYKSTGFDNISIALISNYKKLITDCHTKHKIYCRRLPEANTRLTLIQLILLIIPELINYGIILTRLRRRGYRHLILQDLNEKLIVPPLAKLWGIKTYWIEHINWQPHLTCHPFFPLLKFSGHFTTATISPSRHLSRQIEACGVFRGKVAIIPHGVPKQFSAAKRAPRIVTISRLSPEKGVDLLIDAIAPMADKPRVIVIGAGDDKEHLTVLAKKNNVNARFIGHKDNPFEAIAQDDIFVLPSRDENFPFSVLEALSAGLTIVASNVGGVPEILGNTDNYLFKAGNIADLRDKIKNALQLSIRQRHKLSQANQKLWQTRYNSKRMVEETISIISKS